MHNRDRISETLQSVTHSGTDSISFDKQLEALAARLETAGNAGASTKMKEVAVKWREQSLYIAMCGHFSAGKSTVINRLSGRALLPSSPIPTSANIVEVRYGTSRAEIYRHNSTGGTTAEQIPLSELQAACRDGEQIERIVLFEEVEWLRDGAVLLDTPGVDSTDDAHRAATESALHLADVVVYVTDYNHVQSELNFTFAKKVADAGKPLIWIVNQIDKHREQELSFQSYRDSVEAALEAWNIAPAAIYYVSMRQPEHPCNEWMAAQTALRLLVEHRAPFVQVGAIRASQEIVKEYEAWATEPIAEEREQWEEQVGGKEAVQALQGEYDAAASQLELLRGQITNQQNEWMQALMRLLRDANLTPAVLRDAAQQYLDSRKPGFKVGLLFTSGKTEAERERRLDQLTAKWNEELRAHVYAHLLSMYRALARTAGADDRQSVQALEDELPYFTSDMLKQHVQESSAGSGEYTMNYCQSRAEEMKAAVRRTVLAGSDKLFEQMSTRDAEFIHQQENQFEQLKQQLAALHQLEARLNEVKQTVSQLQSQLNVDRNDRNGKDDLQSLQHVIHSVREQASRRNELNEQYIEHSVEHALEQRANADEMYITSVSTGVEALSKGTEGQVDTTASVLEPANVRSGIAAAVEALRSTSQQLERIDSMNALAADYRNKAERLANNRFTVALFGAFSAGKSSFANALIGANALPVSPNPTTAAINTITAPTAERPHGTALIRLKSEQRLLEDMRYALVQMGDANAVRYSLEEALASLSRWNPDKLHPSGRPHYSFIQAISTGYAHVKEHIGKEILVEEAEYRSYVADESRSAFVEHIEYMYDCEWTRQGFVFVDTPGADSINARHTGVAFEYIKNADMILFVTYYNHAFSQADRQFLTQLGRVKDAFEMDKMFFIVNAADLAASKDELESVMSYVEGRLLEFGIRSPRLNAVSSLRALEGKLADDKAQIRAAGFEAFEERFMSFAVNELAAMSMERAYADIQRAHGQLQALERAILSNAADREQQQQQLDQSWSEVEHQLSKLAQTDESRAMTQECEELLYHVRQRIQYRFNDGFAYAFNPASLRADQSDLDLALRLAFQDWRRHLEVELTNEVLATSLRLEQHAKRLIVQHMGDTSSFMMARFEGYVYEWPSLESWATPHVEAKLPQLQMEVKELRKWYKNAKHFFEAGGRDSLKQHLEVMCTEAMKIEVHNMQQMLISHITTCFHNEMSQLENEAREVWLAHVNRLRSVTSDTISIEVLQDAIQQVNLQREISL
ncbi:dynamin family protein [Paenibacillus arenosi]|uniref:Dynamin family protein n=1 Tax=Paenibacillus arenosi TaxID=2774142 RepID=A0ABR9AV02_9BACL|nr:dynamin family protein [Paenibacillus arenosi]